jgi:signal transduction histidine kinase
VNAALRPRWSIAERSTRWFSLTTAVAVLLISSVAAWHMRRALDQSLRAEIVTNLQTMKVKLDRLPPTSEGRPATISDRVREFAEIARAIQDERLDTAMAWRVVDGLVGAELASYLHPSLERFEWPSEMPLGYTIDTADGFRLTYERLENDGAWIGLAVDARNERARWRAFLTISVVLALASGFGAFASGRYFIRQMCTHLKRLADSARSVRDSREHVALDTRNVPREVGDVVAALDEMLGNIRTEADRTRLLTAGLAHELGSPLQNLIGETEVVLMREHPAEEYRVVLRSHLEELRDIGHAVGNLMTLVSISQATGPREAERFDLADEARVRLRRERAHAGRRQIELVELLPANAEIVGDREALWLAVSNLVANAIDYSPAGGRVRLTMTCSPSEVQVAVEDTGPGVPDSERERIFEPFYRGETMKNRRAGYGLGLSISKKAVDAHGGVLRVDRSPELGGARFQLVLPRVPRVPREGGGADEHQRA